MEAAGNYFGVPRMYLFKLVFLIFCGNFSQKLLPHIFSLPTPKCLRKMPSYSQAQMIFFGKKFVDTIRVPVRTTQCTLM